MLSWALAASLSLGHFFLPVLSPHQHLTGRVSHLHIPDHPTMPLPLLLLHLPLLSLGGAAGMRRGGCGVSAQFPCMAMVTRWTS